MKLNTEFLGKDSEFGLGHESEVPWIFPSEEVGQQVGYIDLEFRERFNLGWSVNLRTLDRSLNPSALMR